MDTDQPDSEPATPSVQVFSTDLHGIAAVQATGEDGRQYCVIDSGALVDNPKARDYAHAVFKEAYRLAALRCMALAAT